MNIKYLVFQISVLSENPFIINSCYGVLDPVYKPVHGYGPELSGSV